MIGVTIGIGEGWFECAHVAARRMEDMTGLDCRVVENEDYGKGLHPSWWKHRLLDLYKSLDAFLYFDADMIPLKPWDPKAIFEKNGRKLCAVRDWHAETIREVFLEEKLIGIPRGTYLNAGLFIFGREHAPVFKETWKRRPKWHRWIDQSAWNRALYELQVQVAVLPSIYNHLDTIAPDTINCHYCGLNGDWTKLKEAQDKWLIPASADKSPPASVAPRS